MCSFVEFNRSKWDICTNLQKKHCTGEQILLMVLELQNRVHHIRQMDFMESASDLEIIYPKCTHLLNLTGQNWTFAPIYGNGTALESKSF